MLVVSQTKAARLSQPPEKCLKSNVTDLTVVACEWLHRHITCHTVTAIEGEQQAIAISRQVVRFNETLAFVNSLS